MKEEIEVKRKIYTVEEQIGDHSYKVERKGQYFFLKKFEDNEKAFNEFCDAEHRLRVSGVVNPKCHIYDKKTRIAVMDYIEGNNCLEELLNGDLPEAAIEQLFKTFWYAKNDLMALDFKPDNFKFVNGKLFYLPFKTSKYTSKDFFLQQDLRLWFFTKEFINYCHEKGIDVDQSKLKSDYETNKAVALMTVKYYR